MKNVYPDSFPHEKQGIYLFYPLDVTSMGPCTAKRCRKAGERLAILIRFVPFQYARRMLEKFSRHLTISSHPDATVHKQALAISMAEAA